MTCGNQALTSINVMSYQNVMSVTLKPLQCLFLNGSIFRHEWFAFQGKGDIMPVLRNTGLLDSATDRTCAWVGGLDANWGVTSCQVHPHVDQLRYVMVMAMDNQKMCLTRQLI